LLCCVALAAGLVPSSDADVASLRAALAAALEANERWEQAPADLREALAGRDAEIARQSAGLERVNAALAVLQRMVFGDSSERSRPEPPASQDEGGGEPAPGGTCGN
jgi:transposase